MSKLDREELLDFLESNDAELRWRAAEALGKAGDKRAEMPLISILSDESSEVRLAAAGALKRIGGYLAVPPLIAAMDDEDEWVRWQAAAALGAIGDRRALPPLIDVFGGDNAALRKKAVQAIAEILGDEIDPELPISSLEQASAEMVRTWVEWSQGDRELAAGPAIDALRASEDLQLRCWAARILGEMKREEAVDPLIAALEESNPLLRSEAVQALERITGEDFGAKAESWRNWRGKT